MNDDENDDEKWRTDYLDALRMVRENLLERAQRVDTLDSQGVEKLINLIGDCHNLDQFVRLGDEPGDDGFFH